jgi:hypothetical protein
MQLIPMGVIPQYEYFDEWAEQFSKLYKFKPVGNRKYFTGKRKQGLYKARCRVDGWGTLLDVLIS